MNNEIDIPRMVKGKRVNWRSKAISRLQADLGMTKEESQYYYNRVYRNALKATGGRQTGLSVAREVYSSMFYQTASTFQIGPKQTITLNPIIQQSDIQKGMTMVRMNNFFEKWETQSDYIAEIKQQYLSGKITNKELNERIKVWKSRSSKYLISGS